MWLSTVLSLANIIIHGETLWMKEKRLDSRFGESSFLPGTVTKVSICAFIPAHFCLSLFPSLGRLFDQ